MKFIIISYRMSYFNRRHEEYEDSDFRVDNFSDEESAIKHVAEMELEGRDEIEIISPQSFSDDINLESHEYQWRGQIEVEVTRLRTERDKKEAEQRALVKKQSAERLEAAELEQLRKLKEKYG